MICATHLLHVKLTARIVELTLLLKKFILDCRITTGRLQKNDIGDTSC